MYYCLMTFLQSIYIDYSVNASKIGRTVLHGGSPITVLLDCAVAKSVVSVVRSFGLEMCLR